MLMNISGITKQYVDSLTSFFAPNIHSIKNGKLSKKQINRLISNLLCNLPDVMCLVVLNACAQVFIQYKKSMVCLNR